jgi:hypothetical protein
MSEKEGGCLLGGRKKKKRVMSPQDDGARSRIDDEAGEQRSRGVEAVHEGDLLTNL